jgi:hypothetical protein
MVMEKALIILAHAMAGWILCGLTMALGTRYFSLTTALIIHVSAAPLFFILLSWLYFKKFSFTTPLQTAIIFVAFVILMDVFVVAAVIERSFEMFESFLGTWLPFVLIFLSTWETGSIIKTRIP